MSVLGSINGEKQPFAEQLSVYFSIYSSKSRLILGESSKNIFQGWGQTDYWEPSRIKCLKGRLFFLSKYFSEIKTLSL